MQSSETSLKSVTVYLTTLYHIQWLHNKKNPEQKRLVGRILCVWEDNIATDLEETGYDNACSNHLAHDSVKWRVLVKTVKKYLCPTKEDVTISWLACFPKRADKYFNAVRQCKALAHTYRWTQTCLRFIALGSFTNTENLPMKSTICIRHSQLKYSDKCNEVLWSIYTGRRLGTLT